jgi:hypothetical protein
MSASELVRRASERQPYVPRVTREKDRMALPVRI